MIIDDDALVAVTCWRCSSPLVGYLWSEPAVAVTCPCGGVTRLPAMQLEGGDPDAQET